GDETASGVTGDALGFQLLLRSLKLRLHLLSLRQQCRHVGHALSHDALRSPISSGSSSGGTSSLPRQLCSISPITVPPSCCAINSAPDSPRSSASGSSACTSSS